MERPWLEVGLPLAVVLCSLLIGLLLVSESVFNSWRVRVTRMLTYSLYLLRNLLLRNEVFVIRQEDTVDGLICGLARDLTHLRVWIIIVWRCWLRGLNTTHTEEESLLIVNWVHSHLIILLHWKFARRCIIKTHLIEVHLVVLHCHVLLRLRSLNTHVHELLLHHHLVLIRESVVHCERLRILLLLLLIILKEVVASLGEESTLWTFSVGVVRWLRCDLGLLLLLRNLPLKRRAERLLRSLMLRRLRLLIVVIRLLRRSHLLIVRAKACWINWHRIILLLLLLRIHHLRLLLQSLLLLHVLLENHSIANQLCRHLWESSLLVDYADIS